MGRELKLKVTLVPADANGIRALDGDSNGLAGLVRQAGDIAVREGTFLQHFHLKVEVPRKKREKLVGTPSVRRFGR